ncbi:MAG: hypothetical protein A2166_03150 [Omnitrophica WOR_2 bacterium RBG_13_41_10]|nr:MAG: hypothetical protein A2166_03150 [Omnitrophica WOR_2 bacterium RBG_13_41_10]
MNASNASLFRFNKYLYRYWKLQAAVITLGLIITPLVLLNPYLAKLIIDTAYTNKDLWLFFIIIFMGAGIFILAAFLNSLSSYLVCRIRLGIHFDLSRDLSNHIHSLALDFFHKKSSGEYLYRVTGDVPAVSAFLSNAIPQIITLFTRLISILIIVFCLNRRLALFALFLAPLNYLYHHLLGRWLKEITHRLIDKTQDILGYISELFSHMYLVKAFDGGDYETKRFLENLTKKIYCDKKNSELTTISNFTASVINKIISIIIVLYGGYLVFKGIMTLGNLAAIMIYLAQLIAVVDSIGRFYETVAISSVSCQYLAEVIGIKPQIINRPDARNYPILLGAIEFRNVSFGYQENKPVFINITFSIKEASKIALVGSSGCGKTTLLALILRLYELNDGTVLIDGVDIKDMTLQSLRAQIGIALQEPFLWNDSIKNNILYSKEDASMLEVMQAARLAEADDFIMALPKGYDTIIGENAYKISEGQKQRIAIARALIKRPKILILDEAMSSLDSETEDKIIENIKSAFRDSTIIVVSHRLSAVRKMELAYFLKNPLEIQLATPEEFIEKDSKYRELFASQIEKAPESAAIFKTE